MPLFSSRAPYLVQAETNMKTILTVSITAVAVTSLACAKKQADQPPPATAEPEPAEPAVEDYPDKNPDQSSIWLDPKVAELCDIPTAQFDFDKSNITDEAGAALDALAACFMDGAAKDQGMRLVGHADPRGTEDYNMALGQRRAGSVAGYLGGKGLGNARLETSSRGELDAKGSDEASWAADRKVEIYLAE